MFPGCSICTILFEEAILAIRYHLRAASAAEIRAMLENAASRN